MEFATDNLIARMLLTLVTLGYSLVPVLADFNKTHATNPLWTPHARFHVVWQVSSYCGIGLIALVLIWTSGPVTKQWLAVALAAAMYGGFFATAFTMPRFGGGRERCAAARDREFGRPEGGARRQSHGVRRAGGDPGCGGIADPLTSPAILRIEEGTF